MKQANGPVVMTRAEAETLAADLAREYGARVVAVPLATGGYGIAPVEKGGRA